MSYPKFKNCKKPISNDDLNAAEVAMGLIIPNDLRLHYLKYNGGSPVKTAFPLDDDYYVVRDFFPIRYGILGLATQTLEGTYFLVNDVIPEGLLPFADDGAGNLFCYGTAKANIHSIWHWNHEEDDDPDWRLRLIAPSFQEFLEGLVKRPNW